MKYHNKIAKNIVVAAVIAFTLIGSGASAQFYARTMPATISEPTSTTSYVKLNVTHQRQEYMLCYPTSASMALSSRGWNYPPRQIKLASLGKLYYGSNTPFNQWTPMSGLQLINGLSFLGIKGWRSESYLLTQFEKGLNEIKDALRKGYPVIILVSYGPGIGHAMLVSGYDDKNQRLIMNDPQMKSPGIAYYTYASLKDKYWKNTINLRNVIFMNPKGSVMSASIMGGTTSPKKDPSMDILY